MVLVHWYYRDQRHAGFYVLVDKLWQLWSQRNKHGWITARSSVVLFSSKCFNTFWFVQVIIIINDYNKSNDLKIRRTVTWTKSSDRSEDRHRQIRFKTSGAWCTTSVYAGATESDERQWQMSRVEPRVHGAMSDPSLCLALRVTSGTRRPLGSADDGNYPVPPPLCTHTHKVKMVPTMHCPQAWEMTGWITDTVGNANTDRCVCVCVLVHPVITNIDGVPHSAWYCREMTHTHTYTYTHASVIDLRDQSISDNSRAASFHFSTAAGHWLQLLCV